MLALTFVSFFFLVSSFIPLIKWDHWWIRIFDYPRLQKLIIHLILITAWWWLRGNSLETIVWTALLTLGSVYLVIKVLPYTIFGKKMIRRVPYQPERGIHLIVGNVYQYNRDFSKAVQLFQNQDPDVLFLVETDLEWIDHLNPLEENYPYRMLRPMQNTYGLAFYSKFPISRQEVHFLIDSEIPSIEVDLLLKNGQEVTIYGIHPTPPVPGENDKSTDRDAEILIVGKKAKSNPKPSLVIGDLNDVAWSATTSLFLKISGMADPRRGRGLYSTFHAKIPFFRWPLDHVFMSHHFGLSEIKVLSGIGSDHFPIQLKATLCGSHTVDLEKPSLEESAEARAKIFNGLKEEKPESGFSIG